MLSHLRFYFLLIGVALLPLSVLGQAVYETIGIIGDATPNGWDASTPMVRSSEDEHQWLLEDVALTDGELKFRANNAWDVNWGASDFPSGTGTQDGPNIPISAGTYTVSFNDISGAYSFSSESSYQTVGIIGSATPQGWDASTPLNQSADDVHVWTLDNLTLTDGEAKFRANNDWAVNWGSTDFPEGVGTQDGPNIPISAGTYQLTFNDVTGQYAFEADTPPANDIVTLSPAVPTADEEVTITYDATQGVSSLSGADKVYLHSGVILSGPDGFTWTNVVGNWGQDDGVGEMTPVPGEPNRWQITLPSIREYYGVPNGTPVFKLGMVFRNANGTQTGKSDEDGDIFVTLDPGNYVRFTQPTNDQNFVVVGGSLTLSAEASSTASALEMLTDSGSGFQSVASSANATEISYNYPVTASQTIQVKVTATIEGEAVESNRELQLNVRPENNVAELPDGVKQGINYDPNDQTRVTLVLLAPQKDFVYVVGDFTNWQIDPAYQMNQTPDGEYFWLTVDGLTPQQAYVYQYWVDGTIRVGDPYADQVADPFNDNGIPESLYPNLPDYDRTDLGIATVLQTGQTDYEWQFPEVVGGRPANEELVVYELLLRDFLESHSYDDLADTLSYLKRMGVNAIELMPIMEFEGNESWGYNPSYALAPDKYYGTENDLREFIDQAHAEGFVVILDMVLNHHFGQSPMVRMYWDKANNRPAENSPWFNPVATHPFNVGYDFNHESAYTKAYMDDVNRFWIEEYEFDGYRFDLSKGFTQNEGKDPNDVGAWSSYDQSRVDILKRMADQIWAVDPNTYIILEHLGDNDEEEVLADYGMMLWGNLNHPYNDVINGKTGTDLNWALSSTRGWNDKNLMVYMESHDEERLMVRALNEGLSSGEYDIQNFDIALERIKLASAFFYTLPGPKMFWQFGELGYDFPIDFNGRVGNKPIPWGDSDGLNYYSDEDRRRLYETKAAIINLVNDYNEVFEDGEFSWTPSGQLREINISHETMNVTIVGNFGVSSGTMTPSFQRTGTWYDFFSGSEYEVSSTGQSVELAPGEFHIYLDQPVGFPKPGLIDIFAPIVTINPATFTVDDRIQIIFDAAAANPADTEGLVGAEKVYLYSGVVTDGEEETTLTNIVGSTDADDGVGLMTKMPGDNEKWLISFRPREYYQLASDQTAYRIGMYFRDASGENVGKGRESDLIYVDITPSQSVVTVEPAAFTADDEIRIVFNAAIANSNDLIGANKVYMHSGVVLTDTDAPGGGDWQNIVGNWGQDDGIGEMTSVPGSDDLWEITLTPRDYYGVDADDPVYYLAMVFRNADGSAEGKGPDGGDIFIRVSLGAPVAPAELMAEVVSAAQVDLSWNDKADDELGYSVERAESAEGPFTAIATLAENANTYSDTELKDGVNYYYRLQATSAYNPDSEFSNVASAELPLASPTDLSATAQGKREIALSWMDNSGSETGYVVERTRQGWWKKLRYKTVATLDANASAYTDKKVVPGIRYYYRVRAVQNDKTSKYTNEVTVRINPQDYIDEIIKEIISTVVVYPNPASQWLRISWYQRGFHMVYIKIRNLAGNVQGSWSVEASGFTSQEIDVSGLREGIYLVELTAGEERKIVRFAVRH